MDIWLNQGREKKEEGRESTRRIDRGVDQAITLVLMITTVESLRDAYPWGFPDSLDAPCGKRSSSVGERVDRQDTDSDRPIWADPLVEQTFVGQVHWAASWIQLLLLLLRHYRIKGRKIATRTHFLLTWGPHCLRVKTGSDDARVVDRKGTVCLGGAVVCLTRTWTRSHASKRAARGCRV